MRIKLLSLIAAAALLAGCETPSDATGSASGSGSGTSASGSPSAAPSGGVSASAIQPGSTEDFVTNVGDRVYFDFDSSELTSESRTTLERQAFWLRKYPNQTITIEGHCDERGTREYNLALGERRASAARDYLVAIGVDPARVSTISFGKERPVAFGSDEEAWSQNRRGVTVLN